MSRATFKLADAADLQPAGTPPALPVQQLWFSIQRHPWSSLVLVPADHETSAFELGRTLYEVGRENFARGTYDRALEALDAVNGEIENLIKQTWGRHRV